MSVDSVNRCSMLNDSPGSHQIRRSAAREDDAAEGERDCERANGDGGAGREHAVAEPVHRHRLGTALRGCQVASEACGRTIPLLSSLEDGRVHALTDCLELSELCAQALGRALEGSASPFLEDELTLCSKVAMACVEALEGDASLERCSLACLACSESCERVLSAIAEAGKRSAA